MWCTTLEFVTGVATLANRFLAGVTGPGVRGFIAAAAAEADGVLRDVAGVAMIPLAFLAALAAMLSLANATVANSGVAGLSIRCAAGGWMTEWLRRREEPPREARPVEGARLARGIPLTVPSARTPLDAATSLLLCSSIRVASESAPRAKSGVGGESSREEKEEEAEAVEGRAGDLAGVRAGDFAGVRARSVGEDEVGRSFGLRAGGECSWMELVESSVEVKFG